MNHWLKRREENQIGICELLPLGYSISVDFGSFVSGEKIVTVSTATDSISYSVWDEFAIDYRRMRALVKKMIAELAARPQ